MERLDTRTQLIDFITSHSPRRAIARACHRGTVSVLGGFSSIPPGTGPGWIVVITSEHNRTWYLAVIPDPDKHSYRVRGVEKIDWQYYVGKSDRGGYSIYDGDDPCRASLARDRALRKQLGQAEAPTDTAGQERSADPEL